MSYLGSPLSRPSQSCPESPSPSPQDLDWSTYSPARTCSMTGDKEEPPTLHSGAPELHVLPLRASTPWKGWAGWEWGLQSAVGAFYWGARQGIRVFSNESTFCMRWPKYWSFSFSISPSNEYLGLISFRLKDSLLLGRKVTTNLDSILKSRDITLPTKVHLVKAMVFPVVMYGCESWTVKKAERRIDAFELWCWRRLLRVPWTARRSNQSILKKEE